MCEECILKASGVGGRVGSGWTSLGRFRPVPALETFADASDDSLVSQLLSEPSTLVAVKL